MDFRMVNVGYGNSINARSIRAIISSEASPVKRMIVEARKYNKVIDVTHGHKTVSVIVLKDDFIVLSSFSREILAKRVNEEIGRWKK